jgi:hypothetical protein
MSTITITPHRYLYTSNVKLYWNYQSRRTSRYSRYRPSSPSQLFPVFHPIKLILLSQLYTKAISERPTSQLVALCDLNADRMKHHQQLLQELGRPAAAEYHPVCLEKREGRGVDVVADVDWGFRMIMSRCWWRRNWML